MNQFLPPKFWAMRENLNCEISDYHYHHRFSNYENGGKYLLHVFMSGQELPFEQTLQCDSDCRITECGNRGTGVRIYVTMQFR